MKTIVIIMAVFSWCVAHAEKAVNEGAPESAVVVIEGLYSRQGVSTNSAVSIIDKQTISKLEEFFPRYRESPPAGRASGWMHGYTVYFNYSDGKTYRITVSKNGGGETWTITGGDLKTNGNFKEFVDGLIEKAG